MNDLVLREFHSFEAGGQQFLYLVPSAAVFALDDCSRALIDELRRAPRAIDALVEELAPQFGTSEVEDTIAELRRVRAIGDTARQEPTPKILPLKPVPLQTLVVNVTNQCNLACTDRYEYGEDKIVDTENGKHRNS